MQEPSRRTSALPAEEPSAPEPLKRSERIKARALALAKEASPPQPTEEAEGALDYVRRPNGVQEDKRRERRVAESERETALIKAKIAENIGQPALAAFYHDRARRKHASRGEMRASCPAQDRRLLAGFDRWQSQKGVEHTPTAVTAQGPSRAPRFRRVSRAGGVRAGPGDPPEPEASSHRSGTKCRPPLFQRGWTAASAANAIKEFGPLASFEDLHDLAPRLSGTARMALFDSLPPASQKAMRASRHTKLERERS